jgi:hypothetical protein
MLMAGEEEEEDKATEQVNVSTNQEVMVPKDLRINLYPHNEWQLSYLLCWSHGMKGCN